MIDLKKTALPQTIIVGGGRFRIRTDFRYFLRFAEHLQEKDTKPEDYDYMYIDGAPADRLEGLAKLVEFMQPPQMLPRKDKREKGEKVLDYEIDADYIYAAFWEQYRIDLLGAKLHWYQFCALLHGLHDTELNNIINARLWKPTGKRGEYEKSREKQYEAWRLPQPEDDEPDEALDDFLGKLEQRG